MPSPTSSSRSPPEWVEGRGVGLQRLVNLRRLLLGEQSLVEEGVEHFECDEFWGRYLHLSVDVPVPQPQRLLRTLLLNELLHHDADVNDDLRTSHLGTS